MERRGDAKCVRGVSGSVVLGGVHHRFSSRGRALADVACMSNFGEPALIITDASVPALLACFMEGVCRPVARVGSLAGPATHAARSCAWLALSDAAPSSHAARRALARQAAEVCHLAELVEPGEDAPAAGAGRDAGAGPITRMLLAAGAEALRRGLGRVVWPVQVGGRGIMNAQRGSGGAGHASALELSAVASGAVLDAIAEACDRALVCARLLSLDAGPEGLVIQTPFVDFTDAQLADLACDVDLPVELAWLGDTPAQRERWSSVLADAGMSPPADPLVVSPRGSGAAAS